MAGLGALVAAALVEAAPVETGRGVALRLLAGVV